MTITERRADGFPARGGRDRHWELFADWCAATGRRALPAEPATVVAFVAEVPVGAATTARRVRAIDAAHRAAGLHPPGAARELDETLGRHPVPSRFDADMVARALEAIPVGGWPAGIVGRRDAAIVALICSVGLTRAQLQTLRTGPGQHLPLGSRTGSQRPSGSGAVEGGTERACPTQLLGSMTNTGAPGACPACALSRWLRVAAQLEDRGWRAVRAELADYGEVTAGDERTHDCTHALPAGSGSGQGVLLFCAIDRHGIPETGYPLSTRSITAIVAGRLRTGEQTPAGDGQPAAAVPAAPAAPGDRQWRAEDRRQARGTLRRGRGRPRRHGSRGRGDPGQSQRSDGRRAGGDRHAGK